MRDHVLLVQESEKSNGDRLSVIDEGRYLPGGPSMPGARLLDFHDGSLYFWREVRHPTHGHAYMLEVLRWNADVRRYVPIGERPLDEIVDLALDGGRLCDLVVSNMAANVWDTVGNFSVPGGIIPRSGDSGTFYRHAVYSVNSTTIFRDGLPVYGPNPTAAFRDLCRSGNSLVAATADYHLFDVDKKRFDRLPRAQVNGELREFVMSWPFVYFVTDKEQEVIYCADVQRKKTERVQLPPGHKAGRFIILPRTTTLVELLLEGTL